MEEARNHNIVQPPQQLQADEREDEREDERWLESMRGSLMVVATVIASITYQAGLNPPGGVWQDNKDDPPKHVAGEAIAEYETRSRYRWFISFNVLSFALSLATILVLMRRGVYRSKKMIKVLKLQMVGSIMALTMAYAMGCPSLGDEYSRLIIPLMVMWALLISEGVVLFSNQFFPRIWILSDLLNHIRNLIGPRVIRCLKFAVIGTTMGLFFLNHRINAILVIVHILIGLGCLLWWFDIKEDPEDI